MDNKEPIRLRKRKTPTGKTSLYLDIYRNGQREYEYLHLYLVPEKTREDKEKNREALSLAEAIRAKRVVELRNGEYGFRSAFKEGTNFLAYYENMCKERFGTESLGNWGNWRSCLKHLQKYDKYLSHRTFKDITKEWIIGFRDYLEDTAKAWENDHRDRDKTSGLARNSKVSYFNKLRACINQAFEEGIIAVNPLRGIDSIKAEEGTRMYLTLEELRRLTETPCEYSGIRRAFLFSCLTGLRRSDVLALTWGDVHKEDNGFTRIIFQQKKTKGLEYLDITPEAVELMGERGRSDEHIFPDILTPSCTNECIKRWCLRAGIDKDITFHCGRHTFATLMLSLGTDIYTVSKLLGHRYLTTTQIYAKVLDKNKQAAVSSIPSIFTPREAENTETPFAAECGPEKS